MEKVKIQFEWTSEISVGDPAIDAQHKKLLDAVNHLLSAIIYGRGDIEVQKTVRFLDEYIYEHLAYEEKYMQEHNYPAFGEHKKLHDNFIKKYNAFKRLIDAGQYSDQLAMEVQTHIGEWWMHHIGYEDKKYESYIKAQAN